MLGDDLRSVMPALLDAARAVVAVAVVVIVV